LEEQRERLEQEHEDKIERQQALTRQVEEGTLQIEKVRALLPPSFLPSLP
jgi:hypothetical protein